ncbi:Transglutaminase [Flavobacterium sp. 9AF]|uniref:DUF3857 domain-containing protein n=1 Tax=Flavobacterium sp. 9AF TaxID=2653142 RepID=UPI0012EF3B4C|nr:DUF3857 domain-containing protein [Flavobacterium sp. 9AF]VXC29538.1 Transglutaminase [Flavobacterium sp. 9AF]
MKKKISFILFFFTTIAVTFSQNYELGKVTIDELKQKNHPKDSSASAAILFKIGETNFFLGSPNWTVSTEVKFKIKIYKKEGFEFANKALYYYVGGAKDEKIRFKNAVTYNLVNGEIEKTELNSDGKLIENIDKDYSLKKIVMPQVREGSIIEYSYILNSTNITFLRDWYFQESIPVDFSQYKISIPSIFVYRSVLTGFEKVEEKSESINGHDYMRHKVTYVAKNVPAIKEEEYVNHIENYTSILKYELVSLILKNSPTINYAVTWEDVFKTIYGNDNFGSQLELKKYFEKDLDNILLGITNSQDKVEAIYNFVKNKMSWNKEASVFTDVGVSKAYELQTGNVAEINLMLTAMLQYAGLKADPVLLSTRNNGIAIFPNRTAFNYVISVVNIDGKLIYLDATEKKSVINQIPLRALNWKGRTVKKEGSSQEIDLLNVPISKETFSVRAEITDEGKTIGKLRKTFSDYFSLSFRNKFNEFSREIYLDEMENKHKGLNILEYNLENFKDLKRPITEAFDFSHDNDVEVVGDKIFLNPMMFLGEEENPFKAENRNYPVDFSFPFKKVYNISIKIPERYEVEFLPQNIHIQTNDNFGNFKYLIAQSGNDIQLAVTKEISKFYVPSESYSELKKLYKLITEKYKERIFLKKKVQ